MILKTLVTGVAAAAVVAAAAGGVTSIASSMGSGAPSTIAAIQPVVMGIPLPQAPAPELDGPLTDTVNALGAGGSFSGKSVYIENLGRLESIAASSKYNSAVSKGYFPLTATVADVDQNGPIATADVTATSANGATATMPLTFVEGPSPTGWLLTKQSLTALAGAVG
ncbi:MAG: hypothetical protein QOE74_2688 [Mycobacterium sp.]|nr:hypothetical protein [Mycobacterium sp.]